MSNKTLKGCASLLLVGTLLMAGGCKAPKNITYFEEIKSPTVIQMQPEQKIHIRPMDKISISVSSKDPSLAALFNLTKIANNASSAPISGTGASSLTYSSTGDNATSNYTVSSKGTIEFPVLGTLHVAGMTREELCGFIKGELVGRDLVKDPTVTVEYVNTGINVIGEVNSPGRYDINRDQITILDAVTLAGDLTINGQRENVKVLREENGTTKVYFVDLTNAHELLNSPVYYLQQNDVVYVEPNDFKKRTTTVNGNTMISAGFWISIVSVVSSLSVLIVNLVDK